MGDVFNAEDKQRSQPFALKVPQAHLVDDEGEMTVILGGRTVPGRGNLVPR